MEANVVIYSDLLVCFGYKKGKSMDKRTHLKQITLSLRANRSRRSFCKGQREQMAPVAHFQSATVAKERRAKVQKSEFPTLASTLLYHIVCRKYLLCSDKYHWLHREQTWRHCCIFVWWIFTCISVEAVSKQ